MMEMISSSGLNIFGSWFQLSADLFSGANDSVTYVFWSNIQGFANIVMTILLLIVVFSQLTGYGIDNYGIKKMLPKLVVAAILVNLSFLLCQIAVDVSNLIGHGLVGLSNNIIDNTKSTLQQGITFDQAAGVGFGVLTTALLGGGTAAAGLAGTIAATVVAAGGAVFAGTAPIWIIPLILAAIVALIAVIIFFLMLAVRQLLAVMLVIISPLAIACYVLPNTHSLFKKWMDLFKTVLMVYPICAGLYALSKLMRFLTFRNPEHFGMLIVGILFSFLPFLAAPKILKSSMAAFGNIGAMLSNLGDRARSGIKGASKSVRESDTYKDALKAGRAARAAKTASKYAGKSADLNNKIKSLSNSNRKGVLGKLDKSRLKALQKRQGSGRYDRVAARSAQIADKWNAENIEAVRSGMRERTGNYDNNIMGNQLEALLREHKLDGATRINGQALMSQLSSQTGGAKQLAGAVKGKTGESAKMVGEYMARDSKVRDAISSKSRKTSQRLSDIASGVISADTTQEQYDGINNQYLQYAREAKANGQAIIGEEDWKAQKAQRGESYDTTTVLQDIANNVLDKDKELLSQGSDDLATLLPEMSTERLTNLYNNNNIWSLGDIDGGKRTLVLNEINRRKQVAEEAALQDHLADMQKGKYNHTSIEEGEGNTFYTRRP